MPIIYLPTNNSMLIVLDLNDSQNNKYIPLPGDAGSSIISKDSTLYTICAKDAYSGPFSLVAIQTSSGGMPHSWPCARGDAQNTAFQPGNVHADLNPEEIGTVSGYSADWDNAYTQFTICDASADIWGTSDDFAYSYAYAAADFEMKAKVVSLDNTNSWAKAGIMARCELGDNSAHANILVTPSSGAAFQYIKMYWGKQGVMSKSSSTAVFDTSNSFISAWHLGEEASGTGTSGVYKDATANANHGADYIGATDQGGIIGKGHYFDGADDYIQVPASSSMNMGSKNVTISFWVKSSASYQYERLLFEHDVWGNAGTCQISSFDGGTLRWNFVGAQAALDYTIDFTDGTWHHVVSIFNDAGNSQKIYYDGVEASSGSNTGSIGSSNAAAYIGCRGGSTMYFPGYIDEIRVSKTNRSADWIKLEYQNQKANQTVVEL